MISWKWTGDATDSGLSESFDYPPNPDGGIDQIPDGLGQLVYRAEAEKKIKELQTQNKLLRKRQEELLSALDGSACDHTVFDGYVSVCGKCLARVQIDD